MLGLSTVRMVSPVAENSPRMWRDSNDVVLSLTFEEAWELLQRLLHSSADDDHHSQSAMRKLAHAISVGSSSLPKAS